MEAPSAQFPDPKLPRGTAFYKVDVLPREALQVQVGDGSGSGDWRNILLAISQRDIYSGNRDVTEMLIYGSVDPNCHPRIAQLQADSDWMNYRPVVPIVLSAGAGTKTITCSVRARSGRVGPTSVSTYTLNAGVPHVSILRKRRRSTLTDIQAMLIAWSCSHDFVSYGVYLAPADDALITDCMPILTGTNVSGGAGTAGQMIESSFTSADMHNSVTAQPKDGIYDVLATGSAFVRVFATTSTGVVTI